MRVPGSDTDVNMTAAGRVGVLIKGFAVLLVTALLLGFLQAPAVNAIHEVQTPPEKVYVTDNTSELEKTRKNVFLDREIDYQNNTLTWRMGFNQAYEPMDGYVYIALPRFDLISTLSIEIDCTHSRSKDACKGKNHHNEFLLEDQIGKLFTKYTGLFDNDDYKKITGYIGKQPSNQLIDPKSDIDRWAKTGRLHTLLVVGTASLDNIYNVVHANADNADARWTYNKFTFTFRLKGKYPEYEELGVQNFQQGIDYAPAFFGVRKRGRNFNNTHSWWAYPRYVFLGPFGYKDRHFLSIPDPRYVKDKNRLTTEEKEAVKKDFLEKTKAEYVAHRREKEVQELANLEKYAPRDTINVADNGAFSIKWPDGSVSERKDVHKYIKQDTTNPTLNVQNDTQALAQGEAITPIEVTAVDYPDYQMENVQRSFTIEGRLPAGLSVSYRENGGLIQGNIAAAPGTHSFKVVSTDKWGNRSEKQVSITVNQPKLKPLTVNSTVGNGSIYSTDDRISGTGTPDAKLQLKQNGKTLVRGTVKPNGTWELIGHNFPKVQTGQLVVEQAKDGYQDGANSTTVNVELGSFSIQPFNQGGVAPTSVIAGQKQVVLDVPHDSRIVYIRVNDAPELTISRASKDTPWVSLNNKVQVSAREVDRHSRVTLTFTDPSFVLKKQGQHNNIRVVPHFDSGAWSKYAEYSQNHQAIRGNGQDIVDTKWISRQVTNEAPTLTAKNGGRVTLPAGSAAISAGELKTIDRYVSLTDKEDAVNSGNAVVKQRPDLPKLEVTEVKLNGKALDNPQQVAIDQPGVYTVKFKGYDSQGLASNEVTVTFTRAIAAVTVDLPAQDSRLYSTDTQVTGTGAYQGAVVVVKQGAQELGRSQKVGAGGNWTVKLTKPLSTNHGCKASSENDEKEHCWVQPKEPVKVVQEYTNDFGSKDTSAETSVDVELGSSHIRPFNSDTVTTGTLRAGQKDLVLEVPHDARRAYVTVNGQQFYIYRDLGTDKSWKIGTNDRINPTGVTITSQVISADVNSTKRVGFHDVVTLTFSDKSFLLKAAGNGVSDATVGVAAHATNHWTAGSAYAKNASNHQTIADLGETVHNQWVRRAITNTAPTAILVGATPVTVNSGSVPHADLVRNGAYVNVADVEDVVPNSLVGQDGFPKVVVTKIVSHAGETTYNSDNQDQARLERPGRYTVTFKGVDSQGAKSGEVTREFVVTHQSPTAAVTSTTGAANSVLSTDGSISGTGARVGSRVIVKNAEGSVVGTSDVVQASGAWSVVLSEPLTNTNATGPKKPMLFEQYADGAGGWIESATGTEFDVVFGHAFMEPAVILKDAAACTTDAPVAGKPSQRRRSCLIEGQKELFVNVPHDAKAFALRGLRGREGQGINFFLQSDGSWKLTYGKNPAGRAYRDVESEKTIDTKTVSRAGAKINDMFVTRVHLQFKAGADAYRVNTFPVRFYASSTDNKGRGDSDIDVTALNYFSNELEQGRCDDDAGQGMYCFTPTNEAPTLTAVANPAGADKPFSVPSEGLNRDALVSTTYVTVQDREDTPGMTISKDNQFPHGYPRVVVCSITQNPGVGEQIVKRYKGCDSQPADGVLEQDQAGITAPGRYEVVLKAVDSQGLWSEPVTVNFESGAPLKVLTVDQIATNAVKGAKLTLYKANAQGEFEDSEAYRIGRVDEKTLADNATGPAVWENLPAGVYFMKVSPDSKSRYDGFVQKVEHQAVADGVPHKLAMPRAKTPVEWKKIAKNTFSSPVFLAGSQWCVLPVRDNANEAAAQKVTLDKFGLPAVKETGHACEGGVLVADNSSGSDASGDAMPAGYVKDLDPAPGYIQVELPWVNFSEWYVLKEVKAPFLYQVTNETKPIHVSSNGSDVSFHLDRFGQWDYSDLNKTAFIENERIPVVGVLLDSGVRYLLWALLVAGASGVWFVVSARRRAARAARLD